MSGEREVTTFLLYQAKIDSGVIWELISSVTLFGSIVPIFVTICVETCIAYWMTTRRGMLARELQTLTTQCRRRLARLHWEMTIDNILDDLNSQHQRNLRRVLFALRTGWALPITDRDAAMLQSVSWAI